MMKIKNHSDDRIFVDAARWISDFYDGCADRTAFFAWLAESPRHVEELTLALALSYEIGNLSTAQRDDIEAMASQATTSTPSNKTTLPPNVVALHDSDAYEQVSMQVNSRSRHSKWIQRSCLLVAGIAAISLAGWWAVDGPLSWHTYTTNVGEQRTLELEDGSFVTLNTNSQLKVRLRRTTRILQLASGEALFKVRHDAHRPFLVDTGDSVIRAVGTQFDVYRKASGTTVSVLEGTVQVLPENYPMAALSSDSLQSDAKLVSAQATAGETVDVSHAGVTKHRQTNTVEVTSWQQRRLVFHDDTLSDIATEFNRYNRVPKIQVEGNQARQQRFAGTFDANAPDALVLALRSDDTLVIEPGPDRIVIKSRN